jgi:uncharacterized protein YndB with AHSA1/START domain
MAAVQSDATKELTVRVTRMIRAPREQVFDAWMRADLRRNWWVTGKPEGLEHCEVDARVGGRYIMKQIGGCDDEPDNYEWVMEGEIVELRRPERIVFTWNVNHHPPVRDTRVTIELREAPGGTLLTLTHEGLPTPKMRDGTDHGWNVMLDSLASTLDAG